MSREVMRHGKTPQMPRVRGRWKIGFERHAENQDTRHTPDTALQGVWSQVHAQEPEAERGGGTPHDFAVRYPYIEWYGEHNGRVVIELSPQQVQVLGTLRPWAQLKPVSRQEQAENMAEFLGELAAEFNTPAVAVGPEGVITTAKPKR